MPLPVAHASAAHAFAAFASESVPCSPRDHGGRHVRQQRRRAGGAASKPYLSVLQGVARRAVSLSRLFCLRDSVLRSRAGATRARTVCAQVSYLEIYNEQFRDLLDHRFAFNKQVLSVCAWCLRRSSMCAQPQQARSVTESKERADQERHTASVGPHTASVALLLRAWSLLRLRGRWKSKATRKAVCLWSQTSSQ
jgi:hypothetical protein